MVKLEDQFLNLVFKQGDIEGLTQDDMNKYKFAEVITVNEIKRGSFIDSFLSSIREKMYANRK